MKRSAGILFSVMISALASGAALAGVGGSDWEMDSDGMICSSVTASNKVTHTISAVHQQYRKKHQHNNFKISLNVTVVEGGSKIELSRYENKGSLEEFKKWCEYLNDVK